MAAKRRQLDRIILEELYAMERLTRREITERLKVAPAILYRCLIDYGIPLRGRLSGPNHPAWKGGITLNGNGQVIVLRHEHLQADKDGYVMRAIINWEEANGQPFPEGMEPHHVNEDKTDDRPENIMPVTHSKHTSIHNSRRHNVAKVI